MLQYGYRRDVPPTKSNSRGREQEWVDYLPIDDRPVIKWPNDARVALWICPNVLHYQYMPPHDARLMSYTRMGPPDVLMYGRQEFASRAGFWRILEILDKFDARCTAVLNTSALRRYPDIRDAIAERKWDLLGHGMSNTRFIYDHSADEERAYYQEMRDVALELTGIEMTGMGGPGPQSATERTVDILAELGFLYHGDWFLDDQPFPLNTQTGRLISLPYSVELNDSSVLAAAYEADQFADIIKRQFDRLYQEGKESGRVMCISIHPALMGQSQRAKYLSRALEHIWSFEHVWHATGREIAEHYYQHTYGDVVEHITASRSNGA
ncbi:MAG: polysaccharide deacetylase family protein [Rhodospirillales bacterium]|nr:polysaccharide deacetylase family protein [Rhodospirillales bacterium]